MKHTGSNSLARFRSTSISSKQLLHLQHKTQNKQD